jgi:hypothetical protein
MRFGRIENASAADDAHYLFLFRPSLAVVAAKQCGVLRPLRRVGACVMGEAVECTFCGAESCDDITCHIGEAKRLRAEVDRLTAERDKLRAALEDLYEEAVDHYDSPNDHPAVCRARKALGR